ncbi:hypothetical protein HYX17_02615 [Candidatus Woesearchaeota archaeon]|nr:hypothetical protein [Candidatus Woesearchaeota archaeon]
MEDYKEDNIEEIPRSKIKRYLVLILAVILIFLVSTYYVIFYGVDDVLSGLIQSYKIDDKLTLSFKNNKIIFSKEVYDELNNIYNENKELEFKACLMGYVKNNIYNIDNIIIPKTFSQKYNEVVSERCDNETLIDLHSHPFRRCLASFQDIINFRILKITNENILLAVMCEKDRFYIYG